MADRDPVEPGGAKLLLSGKNGAGHLDPALFERVAQDHHTFRERLSPKALSTLATEVIRRLSERFAGRSPPSLEIAPEALDSFCIALTKGDDETCLKMLNNVVAQGHPLGDVYPAYLGAAARLLGIWWEEDRASFAEVTIGAGRIYALLCALRPAFTDGCSQTARRAVFAAVPGEQHFLGVTMAADLFRARGWEVELCTGTTHEELVARIDHMTPPFIGLSGSGKRALLALARAIVALRAGHPRAYILVSGNMAQESLAGLDVSGADLVTSDLGEAFQKMEGWVGSFPV